MYLTGRQAARMLTLPPCSLTVRTARRVLECGLAGEPQAGGSTWLYDHTAVVALRARRTVSAAECARRFPSGIFVSRRAVDARWPITRRQEALASAWPVGAGTQLVIVAGLVRDTFMPLLATVGGFVVDGFDITALTARADGTHDFTLQPPGPWFDTLRDTRVPTGQGREWTMPGWEAPRKHRVGGTT